MSLPSTSRNILLALLLSVVVTFLVSIVYAFYPIISAIVGLVGSRAGAGSGGIGAMAGGLGKSFLWAVLVAEPIIFLITFVLLQRRRSLS